MAEDLIVADPQILGGKPCIRGTRLSVEFLLELAASGATQEQILAQYPQLTPEGGSSSDRHDGMWPANERANRVYGAFDFRRDRWSDRLHVCGPGRSQPGR